jgi:hypothetical protein
VTVRKFQVSGSNAWQLEAWQSAEKRKTKTRSTKPHELNTEFVRYFVDRAVVFVSKTSKNKASAACSKNFHAKTPRRKQKIGGGLLRHCTLASLRDTGWFCGTVALCYQRQSATKFS